MSDPKLPSHVPDIRLMGTVSDQMLTEFLDQKGKLKGGKPVVLELSTSGGDADIGRRLAQELRILQEIEGREVYFLGKSFVFSAGITVMAAVPQPHRFLTPDCELLIHERRLKCSLALDGPLRTCTARVQEVLAEIDSGRRLERDGFAQLVRGSKLSLADLEAKVLAGDWYLPAGQALEFGLVAGLI